MTDMTAERITTSEPISKLPISEICTQILNESFLEPKLITPEEQVTITRQGENEQADDLWLNADSTSIQGVVKGLGKHTRLQEEGIFANQPFEQMNPTQQEVALLSAISGLSEAYFQASDPEAGQLIYQASQKLMEKHVRLVESLTQEQAQAVAKKYAIPWPVRVGSLTMLVTLAACGVAPTLTPEVNINPTQPNGSLVENNPTAAPTAIPTEPPMPLAPTETVAPQQTATAEYRVGEGGAYTEVQQQVINSELTQLQKSQLENWMKFWYQFDNRPFDKDSTELVWKFVFDNPNTPTQAGVLIEAGGEYQGKMFFLPIKDGQFMTTPPVLPENLTHIPEGFGPLEISAGTEGLFLSYQNNNWARVDSAGKVIETIDLQTGQWMKVEQEIGQIETEFEGIFSEKYYPNQYTESFTYIDQESGLEIPMYIGLDSGLPVVALHLTEVGKKITGKYFLLACYNRYLETTSNNITHEEYIELVKQGEGQMQIDYFDEITNKPEKGLYDPRKGISITITGNDQMPLNMNPSDSTYDYHFNFTANSDGQLIISVEWDNLLQLHTYEGEIVNKGMRPQYIYGKRLFGLIGGAMQYWGILSPEHFSTGGVENINDSEKAQLFNDFIFSTINPITINTNPLVDNHPLVSVELSNN